MADIMTTTTLQEEVTIDRLDDYMLGLVLVRSVAGNLDPTRVLATCKRFRDVLLSHATGTKLNNDAFGLLRLGCRLQSLECGNTCTRLPWDVDSNGTLQPAALSHLADHVTKLATSLGQASAGVYGRAQVDLRTITVLGRLQSLALGPARLPDAQQLSHLSVLTALAHLDVSDTAIPSLATQLEALSGLTTLTSLALAVSGGVSRAQRVAAQARGAPPPLSSPPDPAALAFLAPLTRLASLHIKRSENLIDEALPALRPLTNLTSLMLEWTRGEEERITAAGLKCFTGLRQLRRLGVWVRSGLDLMTEAPSLAGLTALEDLEIGGDVAYVQGLSRLTRLELWSEELGEALRWRGCLTPLRSLRKCMLMGWVLSPAACAALGKLPQLRALELVNCRLLHICLRSMPALTALMLENCEATTAAIAHMSALQALQRLDLGHIYGLENDDDLSGEEILEAGDLTPAICTLRQLTSLTMKAEDLSTRHLARFSALTALQSLDVAVWGNRAINFAPVARLPSFTRLVVRGLRTPKPAAALAGLHPVQSITVHCDLNAVLDVVSCLCALARGVQSFSCCAASGHQLIALTAQLRALAAAGGFGAFALDSYGAHDYPGHTRMEVEFKFGRVSV